MVMMQLPLQLKVSLGPAFARRLRLAKPGRWCDYADLVVGHPGQTAQHVFEVGIVIPRPQSANICDLRGFAVWRLALPNIFISLPRVLRHAIVELWANAENRANAPCNFCFSTI